jgi:voltage-gated potassium channel
MYWAVITLTSTGYGDIYPITPIGKMLTMIITIIGIGMVALPIAIFSSGFVEEIEKEKKKESKEERYKKYLEYKEEFEQK